MIAFTDYTEENGATRIIPGSNHWEDFEDRGTPEQTIAARMKAGDVLLYSGKTAHGGGANLTTDQYRRGVAFAFNPGFLTGEEAYPFLVSMDIVRQLSPRVQRLLGFRSQYPIGSPILAGQLQRTGRLPQALISNCRQPGENRDQATSGRARERPAS